MLPEGMSSRQWQDDLLNTEIALRKKLEVIYRAPMGTLDPRYIPLLQDLERVLDDQDKDGEREIVLRKLIRAQKEMHGPETDGLQDLTESMWMLGCALIDKQPNESKKLYSELLQICKSDKECPPRLIYYYMIELVEAEIKLGNTGEAERLCYAARAFAKRNHVEDELTESKLLEASLKSKSYSKAAQMLNARMRQKPKAYSATLLQLAEVYCVARNDAALLDTYHKYQLYRKTHQQADEQLAGMAKVLAKRRMFDEAWQLRKCEIAQRNLKYYLDEPREEAKAVGNLARVAQKRRSASQAECKYLKSWSDALFRKVKEQELADARGAHE